MANENMIPNNGMLMVTAPAERPAAISGGEATDPRIWRPKVTKTNTKYRALVRKLPRGRDFNAYPSVEKAIHYFYDPASGLRRTFPCCKNIPGVTHCPFCEDVWGRVNATKSAYAGQDPTKLKEALKPIYRQLPESEWWGNYLIIMDENHPELNGTVKIWPQSKFQHEAFETPVNKLRDKQMQPPPPPGSIQVDTNDAFIPYDPIQGRNYLVDGKWDADKTYGDGRRGTPTYKESKFASESTPIAPTTDGIYAILDQCYDLSVAYADVPTEQQAIELLAKFWDDANKRAQERANRGYAGGYAAGGTPNMAAAPQYMYNQAFAAQPYQTGNAPMPQNSIPAVPPTVKVQSGLGGGQNAGIPQAQVPAPAPAVTFPTNAPAPAPVPPASAPVIPAFSTTPTKPNQGVAAAPQMGVQAAPAISPMGTGYVQAQSAIPPVPSVPPAFAPAAPAAPAVPNVPPAASFVPPAAPPIQAQPSFGLNPPPPQPVATTPVYESDGDDDLPF